MLRYQHDILHPKGSKLNLCSVAHLAWKKGVCCIRAAFISLFSIKTTLFVKTTNWPMNFAMLPKHYISKILPIHSISAIFAHKSRFVTFLRGVFGPKLLLRLWLINANSLYCSLWHAALRLHQVVRNIQTTVGSSQ